jgi:prepilin peptidase CpaA
MLAWSAGIGLCGCALAALSDLRTRTIPNVIPLCMFTLALGGHGLASGISGVGAALLGALAVGLVPWFLFTRGALGGGDVKLFIALGALCGATRGLALELDAFALASLHGLVVATVRVGLVPFLRASLGATLRLIGVARPAPPLSIELPMGASILVAAAMALLPELVP